MPRYTVKRMDKVKKLRLHWKEQEGHYMPWIDDALFAKKLGSGGRPRKAHDRATERIS